MAFTFQQILDRAIAKAKPGAGIQGAWRLAVRAWLQGRPVENTEKRWYSRNCRGDLIRHPAKVKGKANVKRAKRARQAARRARETTTTL